MAINNPEQQNRFNPNDHLMQLKSKEGPKDYLPVQWRLVWFREQCPEGTIDTEEMEVDTEREVEVETFVWNNEKRKSEKVLKRAKGYARFKAVITDGKGARATGTGSECAADFADYAEKAETKAIGRALAGLGYGTQFAPDLDEAHRIVDAPVDRSQGNTGRTQNDTSNHTNSANPTPVVPSNGQQSAITSSMIDKARSDWAKAYTIPDAQIIDRWGKYLVHILGKNVPDPDITPAQLGKINSDIAAQVRKSKAS